MTQWYRIGTCSVTSGTKTVTFSTGVTLLNNAKAGDALIIGTGTNQPVEIGSITDNTHCELVNNWPYTTATASAYAIIPGPNWDDRTALALDVATYLAAVSGVTQSSTTLTIGSGSQTLQIPHSTRLSPGAFVTISDTAAPTTRYMAGVVTSYIGSTLMVSVSTFAGSGSGSSWNVNVGGSPGATGGPGPANTLSIGTVTTGAPGSSAAATITGTAPSQSLNLTIPQGLSGTSAGAVSYETAQSLTDLQKATARSNIAVRELLSTTRTYYVRTDGNNSNTGLVNNSGGAFLTIQKALDVAATLDTGITNIDIFVADGTYAESPIIKMPMGGGALNITGNTTTPANVVVNNFTFSTPGSAAVKLQGFSCGSGSYPLLVSGGARIELGNMRWTGTSWTQIAGQDKAAIRITGTQTYAAASCPTGIYLIGQASADIYSTLNHAVVTAYSNSFAYVASGGRLGVEAATFTGTATGPRHYNQAGIISLGGKTLPGNAAGTDPNGGQTY